MSTILVTGGSRGLGRETARQLIAAGHTVYIGVREPEKGRQVAEELGAKFVQLDVTDDASVAAAAKAIEADGGLDVLVNNAGIEPRGEGGAFIPAADVDAALALRVFDTNVFGQIRMIHAFLPLLQQSSAPVIVNVGSGTSLMRELVDPENPAHFYPDVTYPASKAAVSMLTVQYAKAFPDIRINVVDPGFTATELNFHAGHQTVEEGAEIIVRMAQIGPDGPTGLFFDRFKTIPW
ncbi:SDR family NAD(P)-dependent oxidoreductase [Streptomyces sp. NPDC001792]|uniref:SDR family NAD(P)-dependent oxidoreductase n=1 Tax=Streptomyces sp. NPDC001792 TaxID=3154524 RepID=UPI00331DB402